MMKILDPPLTGEGKDGSLLKRLREKQGVSQRTLAEKCGISRGRLRRLEDKEFELATYAELKRISKALGIETKEIFQAGEPETYRPSLGRAHQGFFQWDARSVGYKITSSLPPRPALFSGKLFVQPKKRLSALHTPRAKTIFLQMILGTFRIEAAGETYEIHEGDSFLFPGDSPYTIENPLLRDSVAFLVTVPAFTSY